MLQGLSMTTFPMNFGAAFSATAEEAGILQLIAAIVFSLLLVVLSAWFSVGLHKAILVSIAR